MSDRLAEFKADLDSLTDYRMVRKHIVFGKCAVLTDEQYADLRTRIAEKYQLHPTEVLMVGSAKLGFSIAPDKRYRHFGDKSDLDIAIVSAPLFLTMWDALWQYDNNGEYWPDLHDFQRYLFQGWVRPDKFPPAKSCRIAKEWWEFFRQLTQTRAFGPYRINGALYRSWKHLEGYQARCIFSCKSAAR